MVILGEGLEAASGLSWGHWTAPLRSGRWRSRAIAPLRMSPTPPSQLVPSPWRLQMEGGRERGGAQLLFEGAELGRGPGPREWRCRGQAGNGEGWQEALWGGTLPACNGRRTVLRLNQGWGSPPGCGQRLWESPDSRPGKGQ